MNQILDTGDEKDKKANKKNIIIIIIIFIIMIAICITILCLYNIVKNRKAQNTKPVITVDDAKLKERILDIVIKDDKGIKKIEYTLNGEEKKMDADGKKESKFSVELKEGENQFKIIAVDTDGADDELQEIYTVEKEVISEALVEVKYDGETIKVTVKSNSEENIEYIKYKMDEEEEAKEENINDKEYEFEVDEPEEEGEHILTVIVVDASGNETEKDKKIIVKKEPTVKVTKTNKRFIIRANDNKVLKDQKK